MIKAEAIPQRKGYRLLVPIHVVNAVKKYGLLVVDRGSLSGVCTKRPAHPQAWEPVRTVQGQRGPVTFCRTEGCEYCERMPARVDRVRAFIRSREWEDASARDVLSAHIRHLQRNGRNPITDAEEIVEYLLQVRQVIAAAFPWPLDWAADWLDGRRNDPPITNFDRLLDEERSAGGEEAVKGAVQAMAQFLGWSRD